MIEQINSGVYPMHNSHCSCRIPRGRVGAFLQAVHDCHPELLVGHLIAQPPSRRTVSPWGAEPHSHWVGGSKVGGA
jgi:hypothetical protein